MSSKPFSDTAVHPVATAPGGPAPRPVGGRKIGQILLIVAIVIALSAVAILAGGEAYARRSVQRCVSTQFEKEMGSKVNVGFGPKPMLITMFDGKLPYVTVNSDDTKFGSAVDMVVHARFNDIEVVDSGRGGGVVGSSSADITWSNAGIQQTLGGFVSGVRSQPSDNTLILDVLGGLAQLSVHPRIVDGRIEIDTMSAQLLGFDLPTDFVNSIVKMMSQSLESSPMGLAPTKIEVTDTGVHVELAGGRTELPPNQNGGRGC
jgi:DUF2993 family protein